MHIGSFYVIQYTNGYNSVWLFQFSPALALAVCDSKTYCKILYCSYTTVPISAAQDVLSCWLQYSSGLHIHLPLCFALKVQPFP